MTAPTTPSPERQPAVPKYAIGDHVQYIDDHNRMQSGEVYRIEASWFSYMKNGPLIVYTVSHPTYRNNRFHAGEAKIISTPAPQAQPDARAVEGAPVGYFLHNGHEWEEVADQFIGDPDVRPLYLSAPAADDGWRDIATAPKDGRKALVYRPLAHLTHDEPVAVKRLVEGNQHCWPRTVPAGEKPYNPTDGSCHVTHWRPLPAPPVALHPAAPTDEVGK